jgi:hypothetical protein
VGQAKGKFLNDVKIVLGRLPGAVDIIRDNSGSVNLSTDQ